MDDTLARLPDAPPGVKGISLFLAPKFLLSEDGEIGPSNDLRPASIEHKLPASTSEAGLLALIAELNRRTDVNGILVQLPLPKHIDSVKIIEAIDPAKDVDGFHPVNVGRLATGAKALAPCTPTGCMILARSVRPDLAGLECVDDALGFGSDAIGCETDRASARGV